jgi:hypothetical protein
LSSQVITDLYNLGEVLTGGVYCIFPPKFLCTVKLEWL